MSTRYSALSGIIAAVLFCSQSSALELGNCAEQKKELAKGYLLLQSEKGNCVAVKVDAAKQSKTIKNMIEDLGGETTEPIPLSSLDEDTLVFVAKIMTWINGKAAANQMKIIKSHLSVTNSDQLLKIVIAANYLDIKPLLNAGLDAFAHKIFVSDLGKFFEMSKNDYRLYKKDFLDKLPKDLAKLVIANHLSSIDRVFVNNTRDRRRDAINQLDLATAQIVAYIAKYPKIESENDFDLPRVLRDELEEHKFKDKILFGPLPEFAFWLAHCPLPNHPSYDMYSDVAIPEERYVDNKDETVTDRCTNLIWEKSPTTTKMEWKDAKTHCASLNKANFTDWRVPNATELQSIVDYTKRAPAINGAAFPSTSVDFFWSSSHFFDRSRDAWYVDFGSGSVGLKSDYNLERVRCVR